MASEGVRCDYIGMCIPRDLLSSAAWIIISHCGEGVLLPLQGVQAKQNPGVWQQDKEVHGGHSTGG